MLNGIRDIPTKEGWGGINKGDGWGEVIHIANTKKNKSVKFKQVGEI